MVLDGTRRCERVDQVDQNWTKDQAKGRRFRALLYRRKSRVTTRRRTTP